MYVNDLTAAQKDGYRIITKVMPEMGYHYLNPNIRVSTSPGRRFSSTSSAAPAGDRARSNGSGPNSRPAPPLEGATYGSFDAACHYKDGTFVPAAAEKDYAKTAPEGGAEFKFWHPKLTTLHVWLWYHNPAGLYNGTNPLVKPFS